MKTKTAAGLLFHPFLHLSLLLLILNDFYFKAVTDNAITAISDVTGLFAFAVFPDCLLPVPRRNILIGVALFFTWWKSPSAGPD